MADVEQCTNLKVRNMIGVGQCANLKVSKCANPCVFAINRRMRGGRKLVVGDDIYGGIRYLIMAIVFLLNFGICNYIGGTKV